MRKFPVLTFAPLAAAAAAAAAVAIAGCGGYGGSSSSGGSGGSGASGGSGGSHSYGSSSAASGSGGGYSKAAPSNGGSGATTVAVRASKFGKILVDGHGRTLYDFAADKTSSSTCSGACINTWPPLTGSGAPTAGTQVRASLLGTTKRADGASEVTYHGHPLYYYAGDQKPGDSNGQNLDQFGARWYVLTANGTEVTHG